MIAAWMLVSIVLGLIVTLGALALDVAARAAHRQARWTWAGAITVVLLLTLLVPFRRSGDGTRLPTNVVVTTVASGDANAVVGMPLVMRALAAARTMLDAPLTQMVRAVARAIPAALDRWLLGGWILCSVTLLVLGVLVLRRLLQARRTWPVASLHGEHVHVAPDAGPAVMGFVRGTIVVPHWLAECPAEVQRVVLAHEREHVRARDHLFLMLGSVCVVLLPWNPAVWWIFTRLRLAVELDCDRRVIAAGVRARDYGTLLIDLAGRTTGTPLGAPLVGLTMLAERTTHLERRIVAMSTPHPRHAAVRVVAGSLVALAAALAACEARMPTSVDVDNMTAASAERAAATAGLMSGSDSLRTYYIDGKRATAGEAHALSPGKIVSFMIAEPKAGMDTTYMKNPKGKVVWIETHNTATTGMHLERKMSASSFAGLVFIDGKRTSADAMKQINPADIATINVIKGVRAVALYPNDPAAAQGVIQITTKHGTH